MLRLLLVLPLQGDHFVLSLCPQALPQLQQHCSHLLLPVLVGSASAGRQQQQLRKVLASVGPGSCGQAAVLCVFLPLTPPFAASGGDQPKTALPFDVSDATTAS
jgi:hypothetical protein